VRERRARAIDVAVASAFGLLGLATRYAWRGEGLFSWDSGLLASGVRSFDFSAGHPHPPYYPLAIAMAKLLVMSFGSTPAQALILLSVLASGVLAAATYLVARGSLGVPASAFAASLVILSPTALFNGIVPLTYALEGAASAAVALAAWRCRRTGARRDAVLLAVALSVAVGIRPSSMFLLAPLGLWAVWGRWVSMGWAVGAGVAATAVWAVPMLAAGGGLSDFLAGNSYQSRHVVFAHTAFHDGPSVIPENLHWLGVYVEWELAFLGAALALAAVTVFLWARHLPQRAATFLLAWVAWPLAFFTLVYAGWPVYPSGYVLVLVPGVAVALAVLAQSLARGLLASGAPGAARGLAVVVVVLVLAMPATWAASWHDATGGQREADAWSEAWWALERDYPANETAILTFYGWFWVRLDHPEYLAWAIVPYWNATGDVRLQVVEAQGGREDRELYADALDGSDEEPPHPIPAWVKQVVVVYGPPSREAVYPLKPGLPVTNRTLDSGMVVNVLDPSGLDSIEQAIRWFDGEGRLLP
jgi:hypothetical protein